MKKTLYVPIFVLIFNTLLGFWAHASASESPSFACVHPELCQLASKSLNIDFKNFRNVVSIVGDPHEFEPNPNEVKNQIGRAHV